LNLRIPAVDVYTTTEIVGKIFEEDGKDLAVVRVDRPIAGRPPLTLGLEKDIEADQSVYVMGFPSGLPMKWAGGAAVRSVSKRGFFVSNLDTFGGNSGSPVFDAVDHTVKGVLVRGGVDYRMKDKCRVALVCPANGCRGEDSTLISVIEPYLSVQEKSKTALPVLLRTFSSDDLLSGSGAAFSADYQVVSDPPPPGYKIGTFTFSLSGDRACNAWSRCRAAIENGRVVFHFALQGHSEWPLPGQAKSRGHLAVTYQPIQ
jgi:hypothetical protein